MSENNEATRILDGVIGLLLFCIVVSCVAILIGFAQQREENFVQTMHDTTNSSKLQRITELEIQSDPVLCTAVANVLSEFGPEELAYVAINGDGETVVYHYDRINVQVAGYTEVSSSSPIEEAVKHLLKYSERDCNVSVKTDTNGFSYIEVLVI